MKFKQWGTCTYRSPYGVAPEAHPHLKIYVHHIFPAAAAVPD